MIAVVLAAAVAFMPDPSRTPGATNPAVSQGNIQSTICVPGWSASVRPPQHDSFILKVRQMRAWGITGKPSLYEGDHDIPISAGGDPVSPLNRWVESWKGKCGAHAKDRLELLVHRRICSGRMTLAEGQAVFTGNWVEGFNRLVGPLHCPSGP